MEAPRPRAKMKGLHRQEESHGESHIGLRIKSIKCKTQSSYNQPPVTNEGLVTCSNSWKASLITLEKIPGKLALVTTAVYQQLRPWRNVIFEIFNTILQGSIYRHLKVGVSGWRKWVVCPWNWAHHCWVIDVGKNYFLYCGDVSGMLADRKLCMHFTLAISAVSSEGKGITVRLIMNVYTSGLQNAATSFLAQNKHLKLNNRFI